MVIKSQIVLALVVVVALVNLASGSARMKRSPYPGEANPAAASSKKEPDWIPVREPKEFKVNVADGIEGANQIRHEKWDKGSVTGMYAQPLADKKWQVVSYVADDKGYRVTSTKIVSEAELPGIQAAAATQGNNAKIDIEHNGEKTSYSVTPDQIAPKDPLAAKKVEDAKKAEADKNADPQQNKLS